MFIMLTRRPLLSIGVAIGLGFALFTLAQRHREGPAELPQRDISRSAVVVSSSPTVSPETLPTLAITAPQPAGAVPAMPVAPADEKAAPAAAPAKFEPVTLLPSGPGPCRGWLILLKHGCSNQLFHNPQLRAFASEQRLALLQVLPETPLDAPGNTGAELTRLMLKLAERLDHPELAEAPVLLAGHSGAFNWGMAWASNYPERVLGVIGLRTGTLPPEKLSPVTFRQFPTLILAGELDADFRILDTVRLLNWATSECVPLTVLHHRGGEHAGNVVEPCLPLMCDWMEHVLQRQPSAEVATSEIPKAIRNPYFDGLYGDVQAVEVTDLQTSSHRGRLLTWLPDQGFADKWLAESIPVASERIPSEVSAALHDQTLASATGLELHTAAGTNWPLWRGPQGMNHAAGAAPPTEWSADKHIAWQTPLAGLGHSSPIVVDGRVVLTLVDAEEQLRLIAFDAATGALAWERVLAQGAFGEKHAQNSYATATVACDGERLFTAYVTGGKLWVDCTSVAGEPVWSQAVGPFVSGFGYGSSPTLYGSLVIVNGDQPTGGYLVALHRETGRQVWLTHRIGAASCGAPIVAHTAGRDQLLLPGGGWTISYNPLTGRPIWQCAGPSMLVHATIVADDRKIYVSGGHPDQKVMAIRSDGRGDVTSTHIAWEVKDGVTYIPSPILDGERLILTNDSGVALCLRTGDGKVQWKKRLGGNFSASPVLFGDLLYAANRTGLTFVARIGEQCEVVAENTLPAEVLATPCLVGDRIYLRSTTTLYCLATTPAAAPELSTAPQ